MRKLLRLKGSRYIKEAVRAQVELDQTGNIVMDTPERWRTYAELIFIKQLAANRESWRQSFNNPVWTPPSTRPTANVPTWSEEAAAVSRQ